MLVPPKVQLRRVLTVSFKVSAQSNPKVPDGTKTDNVAVVAPVEGVKPKDGSVRVVSEEL